MTVATKIIEPVTAWASEVGLGPRNALTAIAIFALFAFITGISDDLAFAVAMTGGVLAGSVLGMTIRPESASLATGTVIGLSLMAVSFITFVVFVW